MILIVLWIISFYLVDRWLGFLSSDNEIKLKTYIGSIRKFGGSNGDFIGAIAKVIFYSFILALILGIMFVG